MCVCVCVCGTLAECSELNEAEAEGVRVPDATVGGNVSMPPSPLSLRMIEHMRSEDEWARERKAGAALGSRSSEEIVIAKEGGREEGRKEEDDDDDKEEEEEDEEEDCKRLL